MVVFFRNECASLRRFCVESFLTIKKRGEKQKRGTFSILLNPKICETLKISHCVFLSLFFLSLFLFLFLEDHHEHTHAHIFCSLTREDTAHWLCSLCNDESFCVSALGDEDIYILSLFSLV